MEIVYFTRWGKEQNGSYGGCTMLWHQKHPFPLSSDTRNPSDSVWIIPGTLDFSAD